MKTPSSLLALTFLATASVCVSGLVIEKRSAFPDDSHRCAEPTKTTKGTTCGVPGTVTKSGPSKTFAAFDAHECAQRCFEASALCASFGIIPSVDNVHPGTCTVYGKTLEQMKFKRSNTSQTDYYDGSCFATTSISDTPLQDGRFSNSGSPAPDPWLASGSATTYQGNSGAHSAEIMTSSESENERQTGGISQKFPTCPGNTYELTYLEGDYGTFMHSFLLIGANSVVLYNKTKSDGKGKLRPALYFSPTETVTQLAFFLSTPGVPGDYDHGLEHIDLVRIQAVYRGTLPTGTTVTPV